MGIIGSGVSFGQLISIIIVNLADIRIIIFLSLGSIRFGTTISGKVKVRDVSGKVWGRRQIHIGFRALGVDRFSRFNTHAFIPGFKLRLFKVRSVG